MVDENKLSIYEANLLYLILAVLFIFLGGLTQSINLFFGIVVTEVLILVVPNIWFVKRKGLSLKRTWRLNRLGLKNIVLVILITILTYPIAVFFQAIFVAIINMISPMQPDGLPAEISKVSFLWSVLFVSIIPGICEEIVFRGTMLRVYGKLGKKKAIIMSAVLFAMFHFALVNFVGPLVLGLVFGAMVYKTNSLYSSIVGHSLNHFLALVLNYFLMENMDTINSMEAGGVEVGAGNALISFAFLALVVVMLIRIVRVLLGKLTPHRDALEEEMQESVNHNSYGKGEAYSSAYVKSLPGRMERDGVSQYLPLMIVSVMFVVFNLMFIFV